MAAFIEKLQNTKYQDKIQWQETSANSFEVFPVIKKPYYEIVTNTLSHYFFLYHM